MKNLFDPDKAVFNRIKRLNNKPKIIILLSFAFLFVLIIIVVVSSGSQSNNKNAKGIDVFKKDGSYTNDDEFIKNLAKNSQNKGESTDKPAEDFRKILDEQNLHQREPTNLDNATTNTNILDNITAAFTDEEIKTLFIPISQLDDESIIVDRDDRLASVHLTATEITSFHQKRLESVEEALRSKTLVYTYDTKEITPSAPQPASFKEQVKEIMDMTGATQAVTLANNEGNSNIPNESEPNTKNWTLNKRVEISSPFVLKTGSIIPATLITGINSSIKGYVTGQVRQDVYDTATGRNLLIPQGTRLVGEYVSEVPYGKERLYMSWQRMVFPDGSSIDIDSMPGADLQGQGGFKDKVNNHYDKIFGNALLLSLIVSGVTLSQKGLLKDLVPFYLEDPTSALSESLGQNLGETISQMVRKNLNIAPELTIRAGYLFNIIVVKDITLPTYK